MGDVRFPVSPPFFAMKLSPVDRQIIELLNRDARLTSTKISSTIGIPERTVRYRIQRLFETGVLKPVAVVDPAYFGYELVVDIFCEIEMPDREFVLAALSAMPEISYIAFSTGDQDISIQALFKNSAEMHAFITQRLYALPGIRRTRTMLVPRIVKDTHQWLPPKEAFGDK